MCFTWFVLILPRPFIQFIQCFHAIISIRFFVLPSNLRQLHNNIHAHAHTHLIICHHSFQYFSYTYQFSNANNFKTIPYSYVYLYAVCVNKYKEQSELIYIKSAYNDRKGFCSFLLLLSIFTIFFLLFFSKYMWLCVCSISSIPTGCCLVAFIPSS